MKKQKSGGYSTIATHMEAATATRVAGCFNFIMLMTLIGILCCCIPSVICHISNSNALFNR
jgi:hypothetical protein